MKEDKEYIDYYNKLDFFKDNKNEKLKLTKNNANFIEAVLKIDSRYKDSININIKPTKEHIEYLKEMSNKKEEPKKEKAEEAKQYGSSKYWINILDKVTKKNNNINDIYYEDDFYSENNKEEFTKIKLDLKTIIYGIVWAIDKENSTRIVAQPNGDKIGRINVSNKIYEYIKEKGFDFFKEELNKNPYAENSFNLIGIIAKPTDVNENYHYSFATKFCKYVNLVLAPKSDKYYIYDKIVISNIDYYIENYTLDNEKYSKKRIEFDKAKYKKGTELTEEEFISSKYKMLWECLEKIKDRANNDEENKITRDEIDHIIWYSNK